MTTLVTGAAGLIGSHLCRRLVEDGYPVVGLIHQNTNPILADISSGIELVRHDIRDKSTIAQLLRSRRVQTVFHLAAHLPHTPNPDFHGVNTGGTTALLATCCKANVEEFVFASSMSIYSSPPEYLPVDEAHPAYPTDPYGISKRLGELLCASPSTVKMRTTVLRYSSVFGRGDNARVVFNFMTAAMMGQPICTDGDGSQSSDFTFVEDAVEGTIRAWHYNLQRSGEVYNIGSGQEVTVLELAHCIASQSASKTEIYLMVFKHTGRV
jgi:UDP-glucose 4-epimerase